jgi:hypothetical protein
MACDSGVLFICKHAHCQCLSVVERLGGAVTTPYCKPDTRPNHPFLTARAGAPHLQCMPHALSQTITTQLALAAPTERTLSECRNSPRRVPGPFSRRRSSLLKALHQVAHQHWRPAAHHICGQRNGGKRGVTMRAAVTMRAVSQAVVMVAVQRRRSTSVIMQPHLEVYARYFSIQ